jgi:hypothetical protein
VLRKEVPKAQQARSQGFSRLRLHVAVSAVPKLARGRLLVLVLESTLLGFAYLASLILLRLSCFAYLASLILLRLSYQPSKEIKTMGEYTGLRFKATIQPFARCMFEQLYSKTGVRWDDVVVTDPTLKEFLHKWCEVGRANFIPFGYEEQTFWDDELFDPPPFNEQYNITTGVWNFRCSLKNYENEIQTFVKLVGPLLQSVTRIEIRLPLSYRVSYRLDESGNLVENLMLPDIEEDQDGYANSLLLQQEQHDIYWKDC